MTRFVALLRGVNVGGVTIRMAELAELFTTLGFEKVKTVLASGNVLFESDGTARNARSAIEAGLRERFHYEAWVHVLEQSEVARIVADYPFAARDGWHRYVVFLMDDSPREELLSLTLDADQECLADGDGVLSWMVERGRTLTSVVGKRLGTSEYRRSTTNRNLNTLEKLVA